ncbi:hypothetical protein QVD17_16875 [Tagetes erecta]|uniref:GAG-pre-integrase domain-containing protein n=1 Tax=Tagetes erecta TaxID=13708 RepID=A0AAD8KUV8_TARER|nr:hypothetical protein QVD17_16875 [Tagetes erecta]
MKEVSVSIGKDDVKVNDDINARNKSHAHEKESMHILEQIVDCEERAPINSKEEEPKSELLGFRNPEFLKWKKELKELAAATTQQLQSSKKGVASISKPQTLKKSINHSKLNQEKAKTQMSSSYKPVTKQAQSNKHVSKLPKPLKFVSTGTFDLNSSPDNKNNSKIKSISNLKTGSGPKTSVVYRFESKKVTKKGVSESKMNSSIKTQLIKSSPIKQKSQTQSPKKHQITFQNPQSVKDSRVDSSSKVNNRLFKISQRYCEICDRYNHETAECFFNRRNHDTSDCFFRMSSPTEKISYPNFQRNPSCGFQNITNNPFLGSRTFKSIYPEQSELFDMQTKQYQSNRFLPRAVMVRPRRPVNLWRKDYPRRIGFKIPNEWVVIKAPRDLDVYKLDISKVDSETETTCLIGHASNDESQLWHRRLGHSNIRNMNKLVSGNSAVGIPSKKFSTTDHFQHA